MQVRYTLVLRYFNTPTAFEDGKSESELNQLAWMSRETGSGRVMLSRLCQFSVESRAGGGGQGTPSSNADLLAAFYGTGAFCTSVKMTQEVALTVHFINGEALK